MSRDPGRGVTFLGCFLWALAFGLLAVWLEWLAVVLPLVILVRLWRGG